MTLRAAVVVDYQNVHITGHEVHRRRHEPLHESLIDPFLFANQIVHARNRTQPTVDSHIHIGQVDVFRGLPDSEFDPLPNARNLAQKERWQKRTTVRVIHRPLKYEFERDDEGRKLRGENNKLIPTGFKEEKGIDVLCALSVVRHSLSKLFDVVILASSDSDLTPALDEAVRLGSAKIETCRWVDPKKKWTFGSHKTEQPIWNIQLSENHFSRSIDQFSYD